MNPISKFILQDKLKETFSSTIPDSTLFEVITTLDKLGALNPNWDGSAPKTKEEITTQVNNKLPKSFSMVSPMFQGTVTYTTQGEYIGYKDESDNLRIFAKNEKDLMKKVKKYSKN